MHPVVLLAIPHRITDKQVAIEVDGVGESPGDTGFLRRSWWMSSGKTGVRRHSWATAGKEFVRY